MVREWEVDFTSQSQRRMSHLHLLLVIRTLGTLEILSLNPYENAESCLSQPREVGPSEAHNNPKTTKSFVNIRQAKVGPLTSYGPRLRPRQGVYSTLKCW